MTLAAATARRRGRTSSTPWSRRWIRPTRRTSWRCVLTRRARSITLSGP